MSLATNLIFENDAGILGFKSVIPLNDNHLLGELSAKELLHFAHHLELVYLVRGQILYNPECKLHHAYFPINSVVSMLYDMENGSSAEIAGIGNEGMLGVTLIMGGRSLSNYAVVQSSGFAFKVDAVVIRNEFNRHGQLHHLLLKYTQAFITQISQTAVCNRHHSIDEQLCRWLLMALDRVKGSELNITQELIAHVLGVRREGVTQAAGHLREAGLIRYTRGHVTVMNRKGLEKRVCECYQVVKKEFDSLLPHNGIAPEVLRNPRNNIPIATKLSNCCANEFPSVKSIHNNLAA